jgi:L-histidine N-alpha-methyltransferase
LWDSHGSELFDKIALQPEYYPTRVERQLLTAHVSDILEATQAHTLVELGPGTGEKGQLLLRAMAAHAIPCYLPVDVSRTALDRLIDRMRELRPPVRLVPIEADFTAPWPRAVYQGARPRLAAMLGCTFGNFTPTQRVRLLSRLRELLEPGDSLLIGVPIPHDPADMCASYDDAAGLIADFSRNLLRVVNRELVADFDPEGFAHDVSWDAERESIDVHLRATGTQRITIPAAGFHTRISPGEKILTFSSARFTEPGLRRELAAAGLEMTRWWPEEQGRYALSLSSPREA